ncbi:DUF6388 family protein [Undibacterium sp. Di27W]|uniref:DUF6388 family protein n=1 Tax=Undibacterium sp. Di27W TaxID=3413036 RepID=UPI003BF17F94
MEEQRKKIAYTRFLNNFSGEKKFVLNISEQDADVLGLTLDNLRWEMTKKAMDEKAELLGIDPHVFFIRFYVDSPDEYREMLEMNKLGSTRTAYSRPQKFESAPLG